MIKPLKFVQKNNDRPIRDHTTPTVNSPRINKMIMMI